MAHGRMVVTEVPSYPLPSGKDLLVVFLSLFMAKTLRAVRLVIDVMFIG